VIERAPGDSVYARREREQRWLFRSLPPDVSQPVSITDLYVAGTRLRLRRMTSDAGVVYKLGQKIRPDPGAPADVLLTNIYLSETEYRALRCLGGDEIEKVRWRWWQQGRRFSVDQFDGALRGLVLAEIELGPDEPRLPDPLLAVAQVTDDDRFCGGTLSRTTAARLAGLLEEMSGTPPA
jgi:CYTH domain-containing protein